jgi:hypothetical protein
MRKIVAFTIGFVVVLAAGTAFGIVGSDSPQVTVEGLSSQDVAVEGWGPLQPKVVRTESTPPPAARKKPQPVEEKVEEPAPAVEEKKSQPVVEDEKPPPPADTQPPVIEILSPAEGAVFTHKELVFEGVTEPGAMVWAGPYQAEVSPDGTWRIVLYLAKGSNTVKIKAVDAAGNMGFDTVTVSYQPPVTEQPKEEPKEEPAAHFSAFQKFGSCGEDPPYDVFWGTTRPGGWVKVMSEYGYGKVWADANGQWELTVFFPQAPVGKPFRVKVLDSDGNYQKFEFVRTG